MVIGSQHRVILFDYADPWLWMGPLMLLIGIITATISWQIYYIARTNPAEVIKKTNKSEKMNYMIQHYLKTAIRNLLKYKTHSIISAICLSVGMTCFSIIHFLSMK